MARRLRVFLFLTTLAGCGGGSLNPAPAGFINQTQHSEDDLWAIWKAAQQSVAQQVDLNPLQRSFYPGTPANTFPGDSRALNVTPHQVLVAGDPDVSSAALLTAVGVSRPDPTGLIACPTPCNVHYAAAYSFYQKKPQTKYAASWEFQGNNFSSILQYEFENHILNSLGYDMTWR
jgi:hypothetical protein